MSAFVCIKCTLLAGQVPDMQMALAPISLAIAADDNNKVSGMSDAELYFKYKAEKSFEAKIKLLVHEMMVNFDNQLTTSINIHSTRFQEKFD